MQPSTTDSKQTWRRWAKQTRSHIASPTLDYEVIKTLRSSELYQNAQHILTYLAFGSEISLAALNQDSSKTFYVTRARAGYSLSVHPLTKDLETHHYGFSQPPSNAPVADLDTLDLVLVPGLCFDKCGTRLGYGKGHYDRLLPTLSGVPHIGVTAEALLVETLPRESFDSPISHIVTELALRERLS